MYEEKAVAIFKVKMFCKEKFSHEPHTVFRLVVILKDLPAQISYMYLFLNVQYVSNISVYNTAGEHIAVMVLICKKTINDKPRNSM